MSDQAVANLDALVDEAPAPETSAETEAVQPTEGQGQPDVTEAPEGTSAEVQPEGQGQPDAESGDLYQGLLTTVPEEYHDALREAAEEMNRNVNAKLQEAAELRKSFEPYGELGLTDLDPSGLQALLQFADQISDPATARDAVLGLVDALEIDLNGDPADAEPPDPVEQVRAEVAQIREEQREREEATALAVAQAEADKALRAEYADVEKLNGKPFSTEERQQLIHLAKRFQADNDRPIEAAYKVIQSIAGQAEAGLVNSQPAHPAPAEAGGRASSAVQPVDDFDTAERLHRERNASAVSHA
jgi:hypothetical protein